MRKNSFVERADCSLCGRKIPANPLDMALHLMTVHAVELAKHPKYGPMIGSTAYRAGAGFAAALRKIFS